MPKRQNHPSFIRSYNLYAGILMLLVFMISACTREEDTNGDTAADNESPANNKVKHWHRTNVTL